MMRQYAAYRIGRYSLEVCDWKGLLERIERIRMRVARELNRPVRLKAQPCGRWDLTAKARPSKGDYHAMNADAGPLGKQKAKLAQKTS
jgi:hypothetical protein